MKNDASTAGIEERAVLIKGLVDALVELYPDAPIDSDDGFFAVLTQTQRVADELMAQVHQVNGSGPVVLPFEVITPQA
jgi:hypothetical protein